MTSTDRRRFLLGGASFVGGTGLALGAPKSLAQSEPEDELQVRVENNSAPELCAEKDNVELDFISPRVRSLQIQAVHPSYINTIASDRWAPDWSSCDFTVDPKAFSQARRKTFWETPEFWLTGYTFPSFWRPNDVPIRVGDSVEHGFHLIQLWMWHRERAEEIMVLYPPDGYWRARPLPFEDMRWTAYGSSFLVGPVETQERPIVDIEEIVFEPEIAQPDPQIQARRRRPPLDQERRSGPDNARRLLQSGDAERTALRGAAVDVRHGDDERRRHRRLAQQAREELGGSARHSLSWRQRDGSVGRPPSAVAPQSFGARHGVQQVPGRAAGGRAPISRGPMAGARRGARDSPSWRWWFFTSSGISRISAMRRPISPGRRPSKYSAIRSPSPSCSSPASRWSWRNRDSMRWPAFWRRFALIAAAAALVTAGTYIALSHLLCVLRHSALHRGRQSDRGAVAFRALASRARLRRLFPSRRGVLRVVRLQRRLAAMDRSFDQRTDDQ